MSENNAVVATVEPESREPESRALAPLEILQQAIQRGIDAESLRELMTLQREWKADQAREAYVAAMNAFKAEPLRITKNRHVEFSGTKYDHATLAQVCDGVVSAMSRHGLSHRWETKQQENGVVSVTCVITHEMGHSERTTLSAPPDDSGRKNSIQQIASTVTYLERYTLMAATGLAARDMDDDGGKPPPPPETITAEQVANLEALITEVGANKAAYLRFLKIERLEDLRADGYDAAVKWLEAKRRQKPKDE